jgi:low affinity Fe/Cu permease
MAWQNGMSHDEGIFCRFANSSARYVGSATSFIAAIGIVLVWAILGPMFRFSDTWQLVINTGTTIVTFLMVFLIQNTQNRDMSLSAPPKARIIQCLGSKS